MKSERRAVPRLYSGVSLNLHFGVEYTRIQVRDASSGGLSFEYERRFKPGQALLFSRSAASDKEDLDHKVIATVVESKPVQSGDFHTRVRFEKKALRLLEGLLDPGFRQHEQPDADLESKRKIDGITFLRLKGKYSDRVREYCKLLRDEIQNGPLKKLAYRNQSVLLESGKPNGRKLLQRFLAFVYEHILILFLRPIIPKHHTEALKIISTEALIPLRELRLAYLQPEGFMLLLRLGILKHMLPGLPLGGFPGCSSFVLFPGEKKPDIFFFARNQDYPVVDSWERNPVVAFHYPEEESAQSYISIASAGVFFSGLTGINESGLALAVHAHFGRKGRLGGGSVLALSEKILTQAQTIQDAIEIAHSYKVNSSWSLFVASRHETTACVIEVSPGRVHVRYPQNGSLCNTNVYISKEMRAHEGVISGAATEDFSGRYLRMQQLLAENKISGVKQIIDVLSDMKDYYSGADRVFGNTIGTVTTIKSVIFDLFRSQIYMSNFNATPVSFGEYCRIPLEDFWHTKISHFEKVKGSPKSPVFLKAVSQYREAYLRWHMHVNNLRNRRLALKHMIQALRLQPDDPHLLFHTANILFKFKRFRVAEKIYRAMDLSAVTFHLRAICLLQIARLSDVFQRRESALSLYHEGMVSIHDPHLATAFHAGLKKPYDGNNADKVMIDLQFPGFVAY